MNKNELRKLLITKRKEIINKRELSMSIIDKLINLDIYKKSKVIAIYKSMEDEVNTRDLINKFLKEKTILLPRIIDKEMVFIKINKNTKYSKSNFGVMEPIGNSYHSNIDLIIVPGVGFDNFFNRLGFGMGYYDKYLSKSNIYKIGLCFSEQMVSSLPTQKHDIKMDMIITENKIYQKKTF